MGAYKELSESNESDKPVEYCDDCGHGIHQGQSVWKIGGEMYCCRSCFISAIGAIQPMRITF